MRLTFTWQGLQTRLVGVQEVFVLTYHSGILQRTVKKHGKQELTQENTARYWTHTEVEPKCSRNFFQYGEFAHWYSFQDRKSYRQQSTRPRTFFSFLGHLQHSHSPQYRLVVATKLDSIWALDLSQSGIAAYATSSITVLTCKKPTSSGPGINLLGPATVLAGKGLADTSTTTPVSSEIWAHVPATCKIGSS